jgi:hypothetical protein
MLDDEDRNDQLELLKSHRHTLSILLHQQAKQGGEGYALPGVINGIKEAREHIRHIKEELRKNGVEVEDGPNDTPYTSEPERSRLQILQALVSLEAQHERAIAPFEIAAMINLEAPVIADYLEAMGQEPEPKRYVELIQWEARDDNGRRPLVARMTAKGRLYVRTQAAANT